jgi:hypothetical protein
MDVALEHDRRVAVPEIVKPNARQFGRRQEPIPGIADRIRLQCLTVPARRR